MKFLAPLVLAGAVRSHQRPVDDELPTDTPYLQAIASDVVQLTADTFEDTLASNAMALVEFYAPWVNAISSG